MVQCSARLGVACLALLMAMAQPSWATDHRCLGACVQAGKPSGVCMKECAYDDPLLSRQAPRRDEPAADHRILPRLQSVNRSQLILNSSQPSPYRKTEDYGCLSACLEQKYQYRTCDQRCATYTAKNGQAVIVGEGVAAGSSGTAPGGPAK